MFSYWVIALAVIVLKCMTNNVGITALENGCDVVHSTPCFCGSADSLNCNASSEITNIRMLQDFFNNNAPREIKRFDLENARITQLTARLFGKFSFTEANFRNAPLTTIDNDAFQGQEDSLKTLVFLQCPFTEFNYQSIRNLSALETFNLERSLVTEIPSDAFAGKPNLRNIFMRYNAIVTIRKDAFNNLPSIEFIGLQTNLISRIEVNAFNLISAITPFKIVLNVNNLGSGIQEGAFPGGIKLQYLGLRVANLTTFPEGVFRPVLEGMADIEQSEVEVGYNGFKCDSSLAWVVSLDWSYKRLIKNFICADRKHLNQLTIDNLED